MARRATFSPQPLQGYGSALHRAELGIATACAAFQPASPNPQYSSGNARLSLGTWGLTMQQTAGANRRLLRARFNYLSLKIRLLTQCRFKGVELHLVACATTGMFSDTRSWLPFYKPELCSILPSAVSPQPLAHTHTPPSSPFSLRWEGSGTRDMKLASDFFRKTF